MIIEVEKENAVLSIFQSNAIETKNSSNEKIIKIKQAILNREWTINTWKEMLSELDEKTIIREFFNSSKGAFLAHKKYMKDKSAERIAISKGEHNFFADENEAKAFHADHHYPVIKTNENSLGTTQGSVNERMMIDGIVKGFTPEGLRSFGLDHYGLLLSIPMATKMSKDINKLIISETQTHHTRFRGEDPIKEIARKKIREYCTKNAVPFGLSTAYEIKVEKTVARVSDIIGKEVAEAILEPNSEKRKNRIKKMLLNLGEQLTVPFHEEVVALTKKERNK